VTSLDPVTLAVLQNCLQQVAEEMDITFDRAAFSPIISEGRDRASGVYSRARGLLIAQGRSGMPIHIGAMQFTAGTIALRDRQHQEGDIYIVNDPYLGGTHLMDMKLIMPVFAGDELFCFLGSSGHWPDIGGAAAGGYVTRAVDIQQEGLRIPAVRLYRGGDLDEDILALILNNVRVPDQRFGDLQAQVASLRAGELALTRLLTQYGAATLHRAIEELRVRSARLMREEIARIRPGHYTFEDAMDNDGIKDAPLWIRLTMTVEGDRIIFDFSRSSPPCRGPLNSVISTTCSAVYVAVKHLYPDIPMNAGCFEPLTVVAPETTFLNVGYPRPVSGCAAEVSQRIVDVVFGAFTQAIPEQLHGAPVGTSCNLTLGGYDPREDKHYVFYFYSGGGQGGYSDGDGISNACTSVGLARTPPIEVVEQQNPILFDEYALRPDSCGPGLRRGGLGVQYTLRLVRGEGRLSLLGDRGKRGPFGVNGGKHGATTRIGLTHGGESYVPPLLTKGDNIPLQAGDTVTVETPGGGGYGPPSQRPGRAIEADLRRGYITHEFAVQYYGWQERGEKQD
jgi:N-methylhydantoinase B